MKSCAIMQPAYLPWSGYFNLMYTADVFVFLDDAQFQRTSWHSRNQIVLDGHQQFITVPVCQRGLGTPLREVEINYARDWRKSHEGKIKQAYARTADGAKIIKMLADIWQSRPLRLVDMTMSIIRDLAALLYIETPLITASELNIQGQRSQRLQDICGALHTEIYLSPGGSARYLDADGFSSSGNLKLHLQNFIPHHYQQFKTSNFIPYMSVIDVIANLGQENAATYIRQCAFPTYSEAN